MPDTTALVLLSPGLSNRLPPSQTNRIQAPTPEGLELPTASQMKVLPNSYLRCLSAKDRQKLGQRTAEEVMAQGETKSEKELQKQIVGLLRLKGIEVNVSRMDKRKTDVVGWPDLTFSVIRGRIAIPCLWEVKMPKGTLSPEQMTLASKLTTGPNAWRYRLIRSVDQAIAELKEMGIT